MGPPISAHGRLQNSPEARKASKAGGRAKEGDSREGGTGRSAAPLGNVGRDVFNFADILEVAAFYSLPGHAGASTSALLLHVVLSTVIAVANQLEEGAVRLAQETFAVCVRSDVHPLPEDFRAFC